MTESFATSSAAKFVPAGTDRDNVHKTCSRLCANVIAIETHTLLGGDALKNGPRNFSSRSMTGNSGELQFGKREFVFELPGSAESGCPASVNSTTRFSQQRLFERFHGLSDTHMKKYNRRSIVRIHHTTYFPNRTTDRYK